MATVKYLDENGLSTVWSKVKGIVTPKADKVSGATAGHLAGLNSSGNLTDSGLAATNVAQKDGSYSGMTVGAAEDLVSAESVASEFTSRITGGSTAVGKGGTALVDKIKGRTLVLNQLVKDGNFPTTTNWTPTNCTITASDGALHISPTSSSSIPYVSNGSSPINETHKYYISVTGKATQGENLIIRVIGTSISMPINVTLTNTYVKYSTISLLNSNSSGIAVFYILVLSGYSAGNIVDVKDVMLIDLTLMFGAGNEPSTAAEFEALYPGPYYDYNAGTLISNAATAIETVGFNQWDEEWETGTINENGMPTTSGGIVRSKNFCHMMPNTVYKGIADGRSDYLVVYFYDRNYNFIPYTGVDAYANGYNGATTFTSPAGTAYFKFRTSSVYGGTYKNDICFNLSAPSRNGTYEPYWRSELELGLGDIKVKSHNVWDEEWEVGTYDSSGQKTTGSRVRCKNYIPVIPGGSYFIITYGVCYCYGSDKSFIGSTPYSSTTGGYLLNIPNNAYYITFAMGAGYGTVYNNDICINLSDTAYNGRYEPYGDGGVISITGGLKSAGTVYDEISGGKFVKRIGSVNLGTQAWTAVSDTSYPNRFQSVISGIAVTGNNLIPGYISKGIGGYGSGINEDKSFNQTSSTINVHDSSYTDPAIFKASLAGVPLYYELASPIEYELAEAIPTAMRNDPYGTERRLPEDTAAIVTAPFRADITYSTNIKEAVQSMHQNFINVNSMQDFLAELGTLMGGTWTMRPADGKFDFTFTPNPVEPTL